MCENVLELIVWFERIYYYYCCFCWRESLRMRNGMNDGSLLPSLLDILAVNGDSACVGSWGNWYNRLVECQMVGFYRAAWI